MADLRVAVEDGPAADWDAFVETAPGGSHVQTSRWAAVKSELGWRSARVVARRGGAVVAGCQVLQRRVGPASLAYAPRGPLGDDAALDAVVEAVVELAARTPLPYLKLQPPRGRDDLGPLLERHRFTRSELEAAPRASLVVDVRRDDEALLAGMRRGTRANVRRAQRSGTTVRVGGEEDLPALGRVLAATSERQGFQPYPLAYFHRMWTEFAGRGDGCLVLAEHGGEAVSALLVVGCNDTASFKIGGWSGTRPELHANELAHFAAMRWARDRGYGSYDLEGFPPAVERVLAHGRPLPPRTGGVAQFKLGFGGEVVVFPDAYDTSPSRWLRPVVHAAAPRLGTARGLAMRLLGRR